MKIAAVQMMPVAGNVAANLEAHVAWSARAASEGASVVVFPELSLTGYEPKLAHGLATTARDPRFDLLQALADEKKLTIAAGMPLRAGAGTQIGMLVFRANEGRQMYAKQLLHADELPYFVPGDRDLILTVDAHAIAPAICYESLQPEHAAKAAARGAEVYLTSVAKSAGGVAKAQTHYPAMARAHRMIVVMANSVGPADDFICTGSSAAWGRDGTRLGALDETNEGLLVVDVETLRGASA